MSKNAVMSSLMEYDTICREKLESKIKSALKVQHRWIGLSDDEWDKELEILKDLSADEFFDFIKGEFTAGKMIRLSLNHPKLAARQLFGLVLNRR